MQVAETESSCRYRISVAFAFVVLLQMHQHQQKSTTGPLSTTCWSAQSKCWLLSLLIQAWETHHRACRYWPVPWYQLIWREWYKKCWGSDWQHINQQEGMENAKRDIHQEKKYFHGCASHGLDLIVKDILVATKKKSTYLFPVKDSNSSWKTLYVPVYLSKSINILEPIQEGIVQIQSLSLSLSDVYQYSSNHSSCCTNISTLYYTNYCSISATEVSYYTIYCSISATNVSLGINASPN